MRVGGVIALPILSTSSGMTSDLVEVTEVTSGLSNDIPSFGDITTTYISDTPSLTSSTALESVFNEPVTMVSSARMPTSDINVDSVLRN